MENRKVVPPPTSTAPPPRGKHDDFEAQGSSSGPIADDKAISPPYDVGDPPPSPPPTPAGK